MGVAVADMCVVVIEMRKANETKRPSARSVVCGRSIFLFVCSLCEERGFEGCEEEEGREQRSEGKPKPIPEEEQRERGVLFHWARHTLRV